MTDDCNIIYPMEDYALYNKKQDCEIYGEKKIKLEFEVFNFVLFKLWKLIYLSCLLDLYLGYMDFFNSLE